MIKEQKESTSFSQDNSLMSLLEGYVSDEKIILKKYYIPFIKYLEKRGVFYEESINFCQILIEHSKQRNQSKRSDNFEKAIKSDIIELLTKLFNEVKKEKKIANRSIKRSSYRLLNILFAYLVAKNPDLMRQIASNYFTGFSIQKKYSNLDDVSEQWKQKVDDLQKIMIFKKSKKETDPIENAISTEDSFFNIVYYSDESFYETDFDFII